MFFRNTKYLILSEINKYQTQYLIQFMKVNKLSVTLFKKLLNDLNLKIIIPVN